MGFDLNHGLLNTRADVVTRVLISLELGPQWLAQVLMSSSGLPRWESNPGPAAYQCRHPNPRAGQIASVAGTGRHRQTCSLELCRSKTSNRAHKRLTLKILPLSVQPRVNQTAGHSMRK